MSNNWIRKPNFKDIPTDISYNDYWAHRGWELNKKLKNREAFVLDRIPVGSTVIDFGCGNSLLPIKLKEKGVKIFVTDISDSVLEGYKKHKISTKVLDLENIDENDLSETVDYMILFEILEHVKYPEIVINKLKKYTNNFLITVPNSACYFYRLSLMFRGRFFTQWVYHPAEHIRFWSHIDFIDWLDAMGLDLYDATAVDGFTARGLIPSLPNIWKNLFAHRVVYSCRVRNK